MLDGGDGTDRVRYDVRKKPVFANLADATANAGEAGEGDSLVSIESVWGGDGRDTFEGGSGSDRIFAWDGARDFVDGGPLDNLRDRDFAVVDSGLDSVEEIERLRKLPPPQAAC